MRLVMARIVHEKRLWGDLPQATIVEFELLTDQMEKVTTIVQDEMTSALIRLQTIQKAIGQLREFRHERLEKLQLVLVA